MTTYLILSMAVPVAGAGFIALLRKNPNAREAASLVAAGALFAIVLQIHGAVSGGARPEAVLAEPLPGIRIALEAEPLGVLFALIASFLWIVTTAYSIGYMRGHHEKNQTRFYLFFAFAIASVMGVAFAGNLFTLFAFYEVLSLATFPLVTHAGTEAAKRAGRVYLGILFSTSVVFQLLGIVWVYAIAGTVDFEPGGILRGERGRGPGAYSPGTLRLRDREGRGHALPPLAPRRDGRADSRERASARGGGGQGGGVRGAEDHGVRLRDRLRRRNGGVGVADVGCGGHDHPGFAGGLHQGQPQGPARLFDGKPAVLRRAGRDAGEQLGVLGSGMHIAMHAFGKITLFFCAGAIMVAAHKSEVSQLNGLGRAMPVTFAAFFIGTLSIVGLPPTGGAWSKWFLGVGSVDAGQIGLVAVLMLSSLLSLAYLMEIPLRGFFGKPDAAGGHGPGHGAHGDDDTGGHHGAPAWSVAAIAVTAAACVALFVYPEPLYRLMTMVTGQ